MIPEFQTLTPELLSELRAIAGEDNISTIDSVRELHSKDQSYHSAHAPDVVVWAISTEQISDVMRFANEHRIPVTPWGVGTSLEGNPIPIYGGISLTFERMNRILQVHADDFQVTVEPGIGHMDLNEQLARYGLFYAPDPGANATIGGMLANSAAGIRTVRYGACRDNVLRMKVVLADGRILEVGSRSVKQSSGYDLRHLIVGSEGTLGIITEATLKLFPVPAQMSAVVASFASVEDAVETVVAVRGSGLQPAALEFIDATSTRLISESGEGIDLPDACTVFMEFHSALGDSVEHELALVRSICEEIGALQIHMTADTAERMRLWHARHNYFEIVIRNYPGKKFFLGDVSVPISVYPEIVGFIDEQRQREDITSLLIGHAGDGNIHVAYVFDDEESYELVRRCNAEVVEKALELNGTSTGEHGVGIGKARFMNAEHGDAVAVMQSIKQALDKYGILNPGKIFRSDFW